MKKLLFCILFAATVITASAKSTFKEINNFERSTTVIVEADSVNENFILENMVFHNAGKAYKPKAMKAVWKNGTITITTDFKKFTKFSDCYVTFTLDDKAERVDIEAPKL